MKSVLNSYLFDIACGALRLGVRAIAYDYGYFAYTQTEMCEFGKNIGFTSNYMREIR